MEKIKLEAVRFLVEIDDLLGDPSAALRMTPYLHSERSEGQ